MNRTSKYISKSENENRGPRISSKNKDRRRISNVRRSSSSDSSTDRSRRRREYRSSRRSRSRSKGRSRHSYSRSERSSGKRTYSYKSSKSKKRDRSGSRDRHRDRPTSSRSDSKDRTRSYSKDRTRSYSKERTRSYSKDRTRSRRSRSYLREYVSKPKRRSSSVSSASSSEKIKNVKPSTSAKVENTAVSEVTSKEDKSSPDHVIVDTKVLDEINENKFSPKLFMSSIPKKLPQNIIIDLDRNIIKVPEVEQLEPDTIFHHNLFLNEEARTDKWVKELYTFRQKALQRGEKSNKQ